MSTNCIIHMNTTGTIQSPLGSESEVDGSRSVDIINSISNSEELL